MDSKQEVMASLEATAKQQSIDDLKARGKTKVKVIRAKDIANLIQQAVQRAIQDSDLLPPEKVDELVSKSKGEFRDLQRKWQEREESDREKDKTIAELERQLAEAKNELDAALVAVKEATDTAASSDLASEQDAETTSAGLDPNTMMLKMMEQLMELKTQAVAPVQQPTGGGSAEDALSSKLDAIVGSLDKKLESFGKKMGVTVAPDTAEVDLEGLFDKSMDVEMESNMDTVELEKRKGGGIAANLERIKKMKGGG